MSQPAPCSPENPEPAFQDGPCFHLEALAEARGISTTVALHHLLEAGTRHLEQKVALPSQSLSKKQAVVLASLKSGHSVKEIAQQIGISEGTVRTHIHRIRASLNLSDLLSLRFQ